MKKLFDLEGLLIDFSRIPLTDETLSSLISLAQERNVPDALSKLNAGDIVNHSENRPALHCRLRKPKAQALDDLRKAVTRIHESDITDIINIGIGGSDLGPRMACEALLPFAITTQKIHFVSTLDAYQITQTLKPLDPTKTLVILSSKSFSTKETLANGLIAKQWLGKAFSDHAYAVTNNISAAIEFGVSKNHIFPIEEGVGGRYSIWSAIAFPLMIQIGLKHFEDFLNGGHAVDTHALSTPLVDNIPVLMGLLNHYFINTLHAQTHAILPYDTRLSLFPAYLQQLEMESNGKPSSYQTGPIIWGGPETDGQHAFHQLLHQGTQTVPVDFIFAKKLVHTHRDNHRALFANCLAQANALNPKKNPSTLILLPELNPYYLGSLIALYEYKVFVSAMIWKINPFDQPGVELGKKMAREIEGYLKKPDTAVQLDISTRGLIEWFTTD